MTPASVELTPFPSRADEARAAGFEVHELVRRVADRAVQAVPVAPEDKTVEDVRAQAKRYQRALEQILQWGNPFTEADMWAHNSKACVAQALYGGFWEALQVARTKKPNEGNDASC